jgi:hypothetical protein
VAKPATSRPRRRLPPLPRWLERARRLILQPTAEWTAIAAEFTTPGPIYWRYLLPMAAIGPVATTLGTILSGGDRSSLAGTYTISTMDAVTAGVLEYGLNLVAVYFLAWLIELLAGTFGGQPNRVQGLKVAAYGATPYWLGGVLALLPKLTPVGVLLGLYSVRLFWTGLPLAMRTPRDKTAVFTLLVSAAGLLVLLVIAAVIKIVI